MPPDFNDSTQFDNSRPSFVRSPSDYNLNNHRSQSHHPTCHSAASHLTDSGTVNVNLDRHPSGTESETKSKEEGTLTNKSSGTSLYSKVGGRVRMTEQEVMELRAAYPHRPSVGTPVGSVTVSPAQRSPVVGSSGEGSKSSNEHEIVDEDFSSVSITILQKRPAHPTPERASTIGATITDSVPPALRTAVLAKRPSVQVQRLSRVPVPALNTDSPEPVQQADRCQRQGQEPGQEPQRYFNHYLASPASAESNEGRAEYRFIPPRRDGVGGPRPRFVPVRPARYKSGQEGGAAQPRVDSGVNSAAWTAQMFG